MSRDELDFPEDVRLSLKRYSIAKHEVNLYIQTLQIESERLFSHFIKYAQEQCENSRGFSEIIEGFYSEILDMKCDLKDRALRTSLTKRFKKLMKRHLRDNSKYQIQLDEFLF